MGREIESVTVGSEHRIRFREQLHDNLAALRRMLEEGAFQVEARRIGVELEVALVGAHGDPMSVNTELLELLDAAGLDFQSELGRFNIEFASPPLLLGDGAFDRLCAELDATLDGARGCADTLDTRLALIGILPTVTDFDVAEQNLSVNPRYRVLNDAMLAELGEEPHLRIQSADLLDIRIPSIAYAAACTSLQVHIEVRPEEFAALWNAATLASPLLVAASANAPLFLHRRLHHETRIALFTQVCDTRSVELAAQGVRPRVWFGDAWLHGDALELFEQNVRWYPALLPLPDDEAPHEALDRGETPRLGALTLHGGTIYRWNRPVYGVGEDGPNLRIENRVMSAGPTLADVTANVALCVGLVLALATRRPAPWEAVPFGAVAADFERAARDGLQAELSWPGLGRQPAHDLLVALLPFAEEGLALAGVSAREATRWLDVIRGRADSGRNGAVWQLETWEALLADGLEKADAARELVRRYLRHAETGAPVHTW